MDKTTSQRRPLRVGVFGAGAIGAFLGIRLSSAGVPVALVGRSALVDARGALEAVPVGGEALRPGDDLVVSADAAVLEDVDVCFVTVKSCDTDQATARLARVLPSDSVVVSFQNGMHNAERLRSGLSQRVAAGMVGFNVLRDGPRCFRQLASGQLVVERPDDPGAVQIERLANAFEQAGQTLRISTDIRPVLAGKLLLNLNNGVGAVTGLTIQESLRSRDARWCFAECIREGVAVLRHAGIEPARVVPLPPAALARLLALPDFVVLRAARKMIDIDERAVTSTLLDVQRGRPTEIDDLNGEVVRIARQSGTDAPVNRAVTDLVHALEDAGPPPAFLSAAELRRRVEAAAA